MDKRAIKILADTYWSPAGWLRDGDRTISAEDLAYAKSCGVMFDPLTITHAEVNNRLATAINALDARSVADAFVASLSSRRLDWRSALGSFAVFQHMRFHAIATSHPSQCDICGSYANDTHDLNVLNFERMKWGGVRHEAVVYAMLDLELFQRHAAPEPVSEDLLIFRDLIAAIREAPAGTTSAALQKFLPKSLKSNKYERDMLVAILGFCGILGTPEHPGFSGQFVPSNRRHLPTRHFVDMPYPACWWTADSGISQPELDKWFGHLA